MKFDKLELTFDPTLLQSISRQLHAIFQMQLLQNVFQVVFDRLIGYLQFLGDFPVGQPFGDPVQNLAFPARKRVIGAVIFLGQRKFLKNPESQLTGQRGFVTGDRPQILQPGARLQVLQQIALRSLLQRFKQMSCIVA